HLAAAEGGQAQIHGQPLIAPLVVEVAHADHIVFGEVGQAVAHCVIGHIGGVMAPGDIGIAAESGVRAWASTAPRTSERLKICWVDFLRGRDEYEAQKSCEVRRS
ncbi:MAG: hypothetical protein R6U13_08475, partial [Desulfatiglandaceae bacterium]